MSSKMKLKILKGSVATTAAASVLMGPIGAMATVTTESQVNGTQETVINEVITTSPSQSNVQQVPYFYYWTLGKDVYLNWDYGHNANRPSKIEVVVDKDASFSNPSYVQVKPKGAQFVSPVDGSFYLRVRFFDSAGKITHESIRKVILNDTETREVKGLTQEPSGTGVKISWGSFTNGIQSGQVFVDGKPVGNLSQQDIQSNSYILQNVKPGSEVRVRIVNGNGIEYNGVIFIKETSIRETKIVLKLSEDGTGIKLDFSGTSFKKGNKFNVKVVEKATGETIISDTSIELDKDGGSVSIYPDSGKTLQSTDYTVTITDLSTGAVYTIDYLHQIYALPMFTSVGLEGGKVVSSWIGPSNAAGAEIIWSGSEDFKDAQGVKVDAKSTGVSFDTGLSAGSNVYIFISFYDENGRIIAQDVSLTSIPKASNKLQNFKGTYKGESNVELSWDKIGSNIAEGIVKIDGAYRVLTDGELGILNSTNTLTLGGIKKGEKHDIELYLVDDKNNLYTGATSSISEATLELGDVLIEGVSGITANYVVNPGVLSLVLDPSIYDVSPNSSITITVDGKNISSISPTYVKESNAISIKGLIPTKKYSNISINYKDSKGETKTLTIPSLLIKKGSSLDSFLVNAYNKAVSRNTQNIDEDGYNYWKYGLLSKEINLSFFIRNLAYVPEFMNIVNSPEDLVTRLYQVLVLRDPEPQGLQFWTNVYNGLVSKGVSHQEATLKILTDMTTSGEFSNLAERLGVNP